MMHMANDAVPMEIDLLNEQLCPVLPWPVEDCKTGVATWWPTIAMRVFDRAVAPYICGPDFIGSCTERPPPKYVHSYLTTLDSGINIGILLSIFENFFFYQKSKNDCNAWIDVKKY